MKYKVQFSQKKSSPREEDWIDVSRVYDTLGEAQTRVRRLLDLRLVESARVVAVDVDGEQLVWL